MVGQSVRRITGSHQQPLLFPLQAQAFRLQLVDLRLRVFGKERLGDGKAHLPQLILNFLQPGDLGADLCQSGGGAQLVFFPAAIQPVQRFLVKIGTIHSFSLELNIRIIHGVSLNLLQVVRGLALQAAVGFFGLGGGKTLLLLLHLGGGGQPLFFPPAQHAVHILQ